MKRALAILSCVAGGCGSPDGGPSPSPPAGVAGASTGGSGGSASALAGNGGSASSSPGNGGSAGSSAGNGGSAGAVAEVPNPLGRYRCRAPAGMGKPGTIEQAMALLNALPKPTNAACFVESLDRPLEIFATSSSFSAQPAESVLSPRIFINYGQLWSSVVVEGIGNELLEFGYLLPGTFRSIKGEVHFPIVEALAPSAPYERVRYTTGTICRVCHHSEEPAIVPGIENVFSSIAFQPRSDTYVTVESLRVEARLCDWKLQPTRCEMLSAIFDGGEVVQKPFPTDMPTFF